MESESDNDNERGQEMGTKSGAKAECSMRACSMRAFERSPSPSSLPPLPPSSCTYSHTPPLTDIEDYGLSKAEEATRKEEKEKRALSSYNFFMKAELGKVKAANPAFSHTEAFRDVAAQWSALSNDQKAQYA